MDSKHDSFANRPNLGDGDPPPPSGNDTTSAKPTLPPATGTPIPPPSSAGGAGGQPPHDGEVPLGESEPKGGPNTALLVALALLAVLIIGAGIFVATRGSDDSITLVPDTQATTESTSTVVDTTTVETSTTIVETTTTAETTTTVEPTTTVAETTTLPPTTIAPTTLAPTTLPPTTVAPTPVVTVPPAPETTMWDVIVNSPDLSEFRAAIESAGLIDLLDGPEPVTVFAPSNAAFAAFRAGVGNEAALADLPALLRHHLIAGALTSDDVFAAATLETLAENTITVDGTAKLVGGSALLVVDVQAGGSVLHVVDHVLVPQN